MNNSPVNNFLLSGKIEGYSYLLLLFVAMPLKHFAGMPEAVKFTGMLHGLLFIWFMFSLAVLLNAGGISFKNAGKAFLLSIIPFGTFFLKPLVKQKE